MSETIYHFQDSLLGDTDQDRVRNFRKSRKGNLAITDSGRDTVSRSGYRLSQIRMAPTSLSKDEQEWLGKDVTTVPGLYDTYRTVEGDYVSIQDHHPAHSGQVWCLGTPHHVWVATGDHQLIHVHVKELRK
jgi:hypothetical protein